MARLGTIDLDTGEIYERGTVAVLMPRPKDPFGDRWLKMSQDAIEALFHRRKELGVEAFGVLMYFLGRLDFENLIQISQADIAKTGGMKRPHVSRAIKKLINLGIVLQGPKIGISRTYRLNPNFGWKGGGQNHDKALRALTERMKAAGFRIAAENGRQIDLEDAIRDAKEREP